jgi:adenylate kinase
MMMVLFGPPGVGKGTQADLVAKKYDFVKLSMGDILREEVSRDTSLGSKAKEYMNRGVLVPDDVIFDIVEGLLIANRGKGILFDGFPRTLNQAIALDKRLAELGLGIDVALEMHLSEEKIIERLRNRTYCPNCGAIYNVVTNPPGVNGVCDNCNFDLIFRNDDDEDVIKKRLDVYEQDTCNLKNHYESLSIYNKIEASGSQKEVFTKISKVINGYIDKK